MSRSGNLTLGSHLLGVNRDNQLSFSHLSTLSRSSCFFHQNSRRIWRTGFSTQVTCLGLYLAPLSSASALHSIPKSKMKQPLPSKISHPIPLLRFLYWTATKPYRLHREKDGQMNGGQINKKHGQSFSLSLSSRSLFLFLLWMTLICSSGSSCSYVLLSVEDIGEFLSLRSTPDPGADYSVCERNRAPRPGGGEHTTY